MFKTNKIYIQIGRNKITVVNLVTGAEKTLMSTEPFSTSRSVLSKFTPANETLVAVLKDVGVKATFFKAKAVIQQMEHTEDGLTDIEKRALRDLAESIDAGKVYIVDGDRRLSNDAALAMIDGSRT